jgi:hypothetical protein
MAVLDELMEREPIFHRPELDTDFPAMITEDFWEVGASGRVYTREDVLAVLDERMRNPPEDHWESSDFRCQRLAPDLYLLTYALRQSDRRTRRSTIWRRTPDGWKIQFHQGTVVQGE